MHSFTVPDDRGPFPCRHSENGMRCKIPTRDLDLTDEQWESLPKGDPQEIARFIAQKGIGVPKCSKHTRRTAAAHASSS